MIKTPNYFFILALTPFLHACTSLPVAPSILALPGTGKNLEAFRNDDYSCRQFANFQIGGETPNQPPSSSNLKSAAVGGEARIDASSLSEYAAQILYDNGYVQCMYAKGHRVPVSGQFTNDTNKKSNAQDNCIPPPPPGLPPPPPPGMTKQPAQ